MLAWMLYVLVIALLLSGAGLAAEHAAHLLHASTRWIWTVAIAAALAIPSIVTSVAIQSPDLGTPTVSRKVTALRDLTSLNVAPLNWVDERTRSQVSTRGADRALQSAWIALSLALLAALTLNAAYLSWRKRSWRTGTVAGRSVYIAPGAGPAVTGFLRPRIVVPEWVLEAPESRQAMTVAHEQAHLAAHDARLLTIGLSLVVLMPWNLPLWWQLHRLRIAIEVDCDARALESGLEAGQYQEMLSVLRDHPPAVLGAACMTESRTSINRRCAVLTRDPGARGRAPAGAFGLLALALGALGAQVAPPAAGDEGPVTLASEVLDSYVGYYVRGGHLVYAITRSDAHLFMEVPDYDYDSTPLVPVSETEFSAAGASVTFVRDAHGQITGLIQANDRASTVPMPRIDRAAAEIILSDNESRFRTQSPTPGGDAALRRLIEGILTGTPAYDQMAPWYAELARATAPATRAFVRMGAVADIEFRGVNALGADVYEVRQAGGISTWMIVIGRDGRIADADSYIW